MYTGFKELIVETIQNSEEVFEAGLESGAVYRADTVYESVEHKDFLVVRFGEPTSRTGEMMVIPWEILGYCGSGNTDKMKKISSATRAAVQGAPPEKTESGQFVTAEFLSIGPDQYDAGFKAIVLSTRMRCVASGY